MTNDMLFFWGWTRNDHSYRGLVDKATKGWNIHALNFEYLTEGGWISEINRNVIKYLEEKKLQHVSIMGHSLGGAFALQFAHAYPEKVKHLYLLDACGVYMHMSLPVLVKNFFLSNTHHGKRKSNENIKASLRFLRKPLRDARLASYAYKVDLQKEAAEVHVPTTILWGEKDHLNPLEQGKRFHELIKNSKLIILPNMDHDWPLHKPELFWENV